MKLFENIADVELHDFKKTDIICIHTKEGIDQATLKRIFDNVTAMTGFPVMVFNLPIGESLEIVPEIEMNKRGWFKKESCEQCEANDLCHSNADPFTDKVSDR